MSTKEMKQLAKQVKWILVMSRELPNIQKTASNAHRLLGLGDMQGVQIQLQLMTETMAAIGRASKEAQDE